MSVSEIRSKLRTYASSEKAAVLRRFFKTGPGEYGEGDAFVGVMVPDIRKVAREFSAATLSDIMKLLASPIHEERLLALIMLVRAYRAGDDASREKIFGLYLRNTRHINNWDLVDLSAPHIVGKHLSGSGRSRLYTLARSRDLWQRRIAILSTLSFIRQNDFADTLKIAGMLLSDEHDLIHKAVGWMLREVGKRSAAAEEKFLLRHYKKMPRTMLRYAIERFPAAKRKKYLNGKM